MAATLGTHCNNQKSQICQCSVSLQTVMAASGSHAKSGRGGSQGGEAHALVLSLGLWSSPSSLPQQGSSKSDVSSPSVNGKSIPPQSSNGKLALDHKVEESFSLLLSPQQTCNCGALSQGQMTLISRMGNCSRFFWGASPTKAEGGRSSGGTPGGFLP